MSLAERVRVRWSVAGCIVLGFALAFGCGGQSEGTGGGGDDDEGGGSAGSPSGGSAGEGGTEAGGSSGTGGSSGSAGTSSGGSMSGRGGTSSGGSSSGTSGTSSGGTSSGTGGTSSGGSSSGTAGMAGEAGIPNGAECASAADCRMVSDCCSCRAEPVSGRGELCPIDCARDACAEGNIELSEVECVMGRCVIARSCAGSVLCPALPPNCGEGRLPSILEGCWGPCLDVTECSAVPSCGDCGETVCVEFASQLGSYHCVEPAAGCSAGDYCECLGACTFACFENAEGVACDCPVC